MREKSITKRAKLNLICNIKLIYVSKLKSNVIGQNFMKKTCNLGQNCTQNDPINHRIKAFHSACWEINIWSSYYNFFLFSQWNLDFKHSPDVEMSQEEEEARDSRIEISKRFD